MSSSLRLSSGDQNRSKEVQAKTDYKREDSRKPCNVGDTDTEWSATQLRRPLLHPYLKNVHLFLQISRHLFLFQMQLCSARYHDKMIKLIFSETHVASTTAKIVKV